ncbi:MAG: 16S rRNA (adenine(1518)-N(6)/adenine(1519)-N(6))-dimethyltransferase RsmA [Defluviitaleaceae bacterium]|nr:16S rRNA (adenine(1518)-N(6)/adenine(1519)-N(6))-dimethyltransferase RsmA [Defluviitaleaceae bacterium]
MCNQLSSKTYIRQLLADNDIYAKKHFGQNFLTDAHVLSKIVAAADISPDDVVIEVGPGLGVLTRELAAKAKKVVAIEIDKDMVKILQENLPYDNIEIVNQDILKTDLKAIIGDAKNVKMAANLPYYITSPIIFKVLEEALPVASMVVMVQKEVADRFLAKPGTKAYGLPSLTLAYYGTCQLVANVPPNCFHPRPDVSSAVIKIDVNPRYDVDGSIFFPLVRAAFTNRRKTFQNNLAQCGELGLSKEDAAKLLEEAGFSPTIRGEVLDFEGFVKLTKCYKKP